MRLHLQCFGAVELLQDLLRFVKLDTNRLEQELVAESPTVQHRISVLPSVELEI